MASTLTMMASPVSHSMVDQMRAGLAAVGPSSMRMVTSSVLLLCVAAMALPSQGIAGPFDKSEYRVPVLQECADHINVLFGPGCGWLWGEGELILGEASGIDPVFVHEEKVGVVVRQDLGDAKLAFGATLADQYSLASWDGLYTQTLRVDEAYLQVGLKDGFFSVGRQDSIANFYDDERLTDFLLSGSITASTGIGYSFSQLVGGNGVQVYFGGPSGWSGGLSIEALGEAAWSTSRLTQPEPKGTLVGVLNYADEAVTAHSTLLVTGLLDDDFRKVLTHSGLTAALGVLTVVGAVVTEHDGAADESYSEWLASAAVNVSDLELAVSASENYWDFRQYDATLEWMATAWLTVGAGREWHVNESEFQRFTGAWLRIEPADGLELGAGYYLGEDAYGGLDFARATVDWMPTPSTKLTGRGTWTEYGDYKVELSAKQRVN